MIIELQVVLFSMNNDTEIVSFFLNNHKIKVLTFMTTN